MNRRHLNWLEDALVDLSDDEINWRPLPQGNNINEASILAHRTSAEDAGRAAQAAGVKMLVLSHVVPADDPEVTERMWIDAAHRTSAAQ